jgi:phenylalanyl-tRNA synthetase beta chain
MKTPLSWLRDYVDFDETPRQVAERLTFAGIEVEGIETIGSACEGLIVAEVRRVEKHPNADKLTVCAVFDGAQELQVVCGAPNVAAGGRYPFAPIGAVLPDGTKIKKAKLRGIESSGMLCSEAELALSEDHSGLMTLDPKWAPGTPVSQVIGPPETVLDLEITPNRPDCLCLIGIARELAALYGRPLKRPEIRLTEGGPAAADLTRVEVLDALGCPRYTARVLQGIGIGPSPAWMQRRLQLAGIRAINNVVDITNYVMLECGQPLHAFDMELLAGGRIVVRRARAGEPFATLDGIQRALAPSMLMIADAERPVALAGVMGGAGSEIREATKTVLLESACFKPSDIRATSKTLGLSTESSYRFERGIDIETVEWASRRAAALMAEFAGGTVARGVVDVYPRRWQPGGFACRFDRVCSVLGADIPGERIAEVFTRLEIPVHSQDASSCVVAPPSFRADLESEIDLIEEVARIHGLDRIPEAPPRALIDPAASDRRMQSVQALRRNLIGLGLQEIQNYSLVTEGLLELFEPGGAARRVVLPNPISADQSVLRTSLIPQMVETLGRNRAHQIESACLFEAGRVYTKGGDGKPCEEERLAVGLMGRSGEQTRRPVDAGEMFLWIKGVWERLAEAQQISGWEISLSDAPWWQKGCGLSLALKGRTLGGLGIIKPEIRREWRLVDPVAVLDVAVEPLVRDALRTGTYAAIPSFPCIVRDVALVVDAAVKNEDILRVIRRAAPPELERADLFDIFTGASLGAGRKSLAYSLTYRSAMRTLTDEEANAYHDCVKNELKRELAAEVRES